MKFIFVHKGILKNTSIGLRSSIVVSQSFHRHTNGHRQPSAPCTRIALTKNFYPVVLVYFSILLLSACSVSKQISKQATRILLNDSAISAGHIGISIFEPATGKYWYNYDAAKYFVPASNTKLFTLYAGMKYLGDSLIGLRYELGSDGNLLIQPTADPTFLHPQFAAQPVYDFLSGFKKISFTNLAFTDNFFGSGWSWDDYEEVYMTQRSNFPLYANLSTVQKKGDSIIVTPSAQHYTIAPQSDFKNGFDILKKRDEQQITIINGMNQKLSIPFAPNAADIVQMLGDTLHTIVLPGSNDSRKLKNIIHSRPVDSLFKPMMNHSDNFFAEQTLLMTGSVLLNYMNDQKIIDTILNNDLKDVPQKPNWVDGSGLSRYNLFTPQSFVYILHKMKNEFGLERLKNILPTGGKGTLTNYFKKDSSFIFAKTGTLSNHCALSGFVITRKNKLLIFSILANHYQTGSTPVRRAMEKFIEGIREKY